MPTIPSFDIPKGYRAQSEDTSIEIDYLQFQRWREIPLTQKAQLTIGITKGCRQLSLQKIDIFILKKSLLSQTEMKRRTVQNIDEKGRSLYLATAEDIIIEKLLWYQEGNYISERQWQWRDILGVLKTQRERLDFDYLNYWAVATNLSDLLKIALKQSGLIVENEN